jgi:hypothetical protein
MGRALDGVWELDQRYKTELGSCPVDGGNITLRRPSVLLAKQPNLCGRRHDPGD